MRRPLPPLHALRAFEAAARLGRMTAAAQELSVTPGAISRQVRQLEDALGVALFEGPKHQPRLTEAGAQLRPALSQAFDTLAQAVDAVRPSASGPVDVACFHSFMLKWLIPRLPDFHRQHPELPLRLSVADPDRSPAPGADVWIAVVAEPTEADTVLFAERLGPVATPALAAQHPTPADWPSRQLLQTQQRLDAWARWATVAGQPAPAPEGPCHAHYLFTLEAAASGLGLAVAPQHLVADELRSGRLVAPWGWAPSGLHYVARTARRPASPAVGPFLRWLVAQSL